MVGERTHSDINRDTVVEVHQLSQLLVHLSRIQDTISRVRGEHPVREPPQDNLAGANENTPLLSHGPNPPTSFTDDAKVFTANIALLALADAFLICCLSTDVHYPPHPDFGYHAFRLVASFIAVFLSFGGVLFHVGLAKSLLKASVITCLSVTISYLVSFFAPLFPEGRNRHIVLIIIQTVLTVIVAAITTCVPM